MTMFDGAVAHRLLQRELGDGRRYSKVRGMYGDRKWINDMDIVNELGGHSGCVNALSWSRSGRLLASGSDDLHVNIHSYLPESTTSQFNLDTTILTGHTQNIFSVKFMPHSNDRTIVTAAGDGEVRIFDIEHSNNYTAQSPGRESTARPGRAGVGLHGFLDEVRLLTEGDTNGKVFRSHSDRVKRIVTESSPFFFLTCSEDGEVRQWDTRQPSSAYPAQRDHYPRWASSAHASDTVPPPLISYKQYHLDLNTISCSPSQPHYIALGGAHLHCFLHDRRMLGRDKVAERGAKLSSPGNWSDHDDELMGQATQCVRKFAPHGQQRMRRTDNGHITACKISDANPNEIVASWSGEWIYSFDLVRSPDASEQTEEQEPRTSKGTGIHKAKESKLRKRKRPKSSSMVSQEGLERAQSRQRTESSQGSEPQEQMALMVQYENGQSEEIPIEPPSRTHSPSPDVTESAPMSALGQSFRIAGTSVKLRRSMFTLGKGRKPSTTDPTGHALSFTSALGFAASILPEMDEIARTWRYPVDPSEIDVAFQNKLRESRSASRRFVQACGTLARVLGGRLRTGGNSDAMLAQYFTTIRPAPNERPPPRHEQFGYDFLKAILLWLDSGIGALLEGFTNSSPLSSRLPIGKDAGVDAVDDLLIPYLLRLASNSPIVDVDTSRFEVDENRVLFSSEQAAVLAFASALKIPFDDLSSAAVTTSSTEAGDTDIRNIHAQDRRTALKFWAFRVGRGVLMNAGKAVNFAFVDRAFGGIGKANAATMAEERALWMQQEDIDPDEEDDVVDAELVSRAWADQSIERDPPTASRSSEQTDIVDANGNGTQSSTGAPYVTIASDDEDDSDGDVDPEDLEDEVEDDYSEDENGATTSHLLWRSAFDRSRYRERVESDIPCAAHTRQYRGHCNVKTVKDVNFFGLQDEYVVSGSDSGHVFIWDRKTSQLVNILEGDGEVVNVVQGHPYEPMLAVSGIDHTIKIFSPDARARQAACQGVGIHPADPATFSSLRFARSRRRHQSSANRYEPEVSESKDEEESESEDSEERIAPNGLSSKKRMQDEYQIISQNDVDRKGGSRDAFITRAMLAQLAERFHANQGNDDDGEDGHTGQVLISDDCTVM